LAQNEQAMHAMATASLNGDDSELAISFKGVRYDWGWMRGVADRLEALLQKAGVGPGDAIGFAPRNRPECGAALLGLIAAGHDIVMIYSYQSAEAIGRKISDLRCAAIVGPADIWGDPARDAAIATGALAIALDGAEVTVIDGTTLDRTVDHRAAEEYPGIALLTSGTTGAPKHFHMSYEVVTRALIRETAMPDLVKKVSGLPPAKTMSLQALPFGNIGGLYAYLPHALARHPVTMLEKFSLDDWLAYIREWRPKSGGLPPAAVRMVLDANVPSEDLSSIRFISSGAATLDPTAHREFEERYGIPILLSYGATEFGGIVSLMTFDDHAKYGAEKFGSVGRPWAGAQLQVVDPVSRELLPADTEGELEVLAPRMGSDWIRTTDLAIIDADGFIFHRGRSDGALMRGGFKIVPEVVSAALAEHPAIGAAAVVGIADRRLGEVPVAAYELRPDSPPVTSEDLEAHLRRSLPSTHLPVRYIEVESLPRTPSLKLDIMAVRRLFEAEAASA